MGEENNGRPSHAPASERDGQPGENGREPNAENGEAREFERFKALTRLLVHTPKPTRD